MKEVDIGMNILASLAIVIFEETAQILIAQGEIIFAEEKIDIV